MIVKELKEFQSEIILPNLEQNCMLQINEIKMSQDRTQNKNVTGNEAGQICCNLSMLTLEVSVILLPWGSTTPQI